MKLLELAEVVLLHVQIGDFEVSVWFVDVTAFVVEILSGTVMDCNVCVIPYSIRRIKLRNSIPVYMSAMRLEKILFIIVIITNNVSTATDILSRKRIRVRRETVIPSRSEPPVFVVPTMAGVLLIEFQPLIR